MAHFYGEAYVAGYDNIQPDGWPVRVQVSHDNECRWYDSTDHSTATAAIEELLQAGEVKATLHIQSPAPGIWQAWLEGQGELVTDTTIEGAVAKLIAS